MGTKAQGEFLNDWVVAWGMEQATGFSDMWSEILQALLVILVLEQFWVLPAERWFEEQVDFLSIQATLAATANMGFFTRVWIHMRHVAFIAGE